MPSTCIICNSSAYKIKLIIESFKIVKCQRCSLVYLQNPLPPENDVITYNEYFRQSALAPYEKNSSNPAMKILWELNEQRLRWIQRIKPEGMLLDIGSGRGYFLHHASLLGYHVTGIEVSPVAAKFCQQNFHIKTSIQNVEEDVNDLYKYDIITLWHVLEHLSNPLKVLSNLKSLLSPKGVLLIEVPNINSLKFILSPKQKKWIGGNHPRHHRFFFSARTLSIMLSRAGFNYIRNVPFAYHLSCWNPIKTKLKHGLKILNLDSFINAYVH